MGAEQAFKLLSIHPIAPDPILQLGLPVEVHGSRNVSLAVQGDVFGDFDDPDGWIAQVVVEPGRLNQDLRMRVPCRHYRPSPKVPCVR